MRAVLKTHTIDPNIPDNPIDSEALNRLLEREKVYKVRLPRKKDIAMAHCSTLGESPNHFLIKTGPIAAPIPLQENIIPTPLDTKVGSDHKRLANKGINVIIPPLIAIPDFNRASARTIG